MTEPAEIRAASVAGMATVGGLNLLLMEHQADRWGRCNGCRLPQSGTPIWPCSVFTLASRARELQLLGRLAG